MHRLVFASRQKTAASASAIFTLSMEGQYPALAPSSFKLALLKCNTEEDHYLIGWHVNYYCLSYQE